MAGLDVHPRHAQLGPRQRLGGDHRFAQHAGLFVAVEAQQQFGADACGVQPVGFALFETRQAELGRIVEALCLDGREDGFQMGFAQPGDLQPVEKRGSGEGLEQVAVERRFGSLGHDGVRGFAGDHEEHGGERQQLGAAQVVEQVLPRIRGVGEILFAQHKIELRMFQSCARL